MVSQILNSIGLSLVFIGCVLLYFFGLPPRVDPTGAVHLILEHADEVEVAKGESYLRRGRLGIGLVALGSAFQLLAVWWP